MPSDTSLDPITKLRELWSGSDVPSPAFGAAGLEGSGFAETPGEIFHLVMQWALHSDDSDPNFIFQLQLVCKAFYNHLQNHFCDMKALRMLANRDSVAIAELMLLDIAKSGFSGADATPYCVTNFIRGSRYFRGIDFCYYQCTGKKTPLLLQLSYAGIRPVLRTFRKDTSGRCALVDRWQDASDICVLINVPVNRVPKIGLGRHGDEALANCLKSDDQICLDIWGNLMPIPNLVEMAAPEPRRQLRFMR